MTERSPHNFISDADGWPLSIFHHLGHMICSHAQKLGFLSFMPHALDRARSDSERQRGSEQVTRVEEVPTYPPTEYTRTPSRYDSTRVNVARYSLFNALSDVSQLGTDGNEFTLTNDLTYHNEVFPFRPKFGTSCMVKRVWSRLIHKIRCGSAQDSVRSPVSARHHQMHD